MTTRRHHSLGLLFALLALLVQLGVGVSVPRGNPDAGVAAATAICHTDGDAAGGSAPVAPHTPDCAICPLCVTVASAGFVVPDDGPAIRTSRTVVIGRAAVPPQAAAPPSQPRFAAQPRAPPFQA